MEFLWDFKGFPLCFANCTEAELEEFIETNDDVAAASGAVLMLATGAGFVPGVSCETTIYFGDSAASSLGLSSVLVSVAMSGLWWLYNL